MLAWILFATTLFLAIITHGWYYLHVKKQRSIAQQAHQNALLAQVTEHHASVRRLQREFEQSRHQESYNFVLTLLPALDALGQAVQSTQDHTASPDDIAVGLVYIWKEILKTLHEQGFVPIHPQPGEPFDPTKHEAIGVIDTPEHLPGTIACVLRTGWQHRDRILRPATVQTTRRVES